MGKPESGHAIMHRLSCAAARAAGGCADRGGAYRKPPRRRQRQRCQIVRRGIRGLCLRPVRALDRSPADWRRGAKHVDRDSRLSTRPQTSSPLVGDASVRGFSSPASIRTAKAALRRWVGDIRPSSPCSTSRCRAWTGMELLRRLREKCDFPVIFLTSKDEELDEALGLAMGADDYIASPSRSGCCWPGSAPFCAGPRCARAGPRRGRAARHPRDRARPPDHGSAAGPGELDARIVTLTVTNS